MRFLLSKGHIFKTKTDTEVIVHLYEELGPECLQKLRGMFALRDLGSKYEDPFPGAGPGRNQAALLLLDGRRLLFSVPKSRLFSRILPSSERLPPNSSTAF